MASRHSISDQTLEESALSSFTITNPSIALDAENKIIYRRPGYPSQVAIVSGCGSGHAPAFGGFVGDGLLTAAVTGSNFASPNAEQVRYALLSKVDTENGVLAIVSNYTGETLTFGSAVEHAKSAGLNAKLLVIGDDVAIGRSRLGKNGRRGLAGIVLVHKIAGALAARGANLEDVYKVAKLTGDNIVTVAASLGHFSIPGEVSVADPGRQETEGLELRLGSGSDDTVLDDFVELIKQMLKQLLDLEDAERGFLRVNSNEVVLLVNNLGGTSPQELGAMTTEVLRQLERDYNIKPIRIFTGTSLTQLDRYGFSISILNIVNTDIGGPSMLQLLDDPSEATAWVAPIRKETWETREEQSHNIRENPTSIDEEPKKSGLKLEPSIIDSAVRAGLARLLAVETDLTTCDELVGDGDCGTAMKKGAQAIIEMLSEEPCTGDIVVDLSRIARVFERSMAGTMGALCSIFLGALIDALIHESWPSPTEVTPQMWATALRKAYRRLSTYTPAEPGDRTIIDALDPFIETFETTHNLKEAAEASNKGTAGTTGMVPKLGKAVFVENTPYEKVPDPGALAFSEFVLGLAGVDAEDAEEFELV